MVHRMLPTNKSCGQYAAHCRLGNGLFNLTVITKQKKKVTLNSLFIINVMTR